MRCPARIGQRSQDCVVAAMAKIKAPIPIKETHSCVAHASGTERPTTNSPVCQRVLRKEQQIAQLAQRH